MRRALVTALLTPLVTMPVGALIAAPLAHACTDSDDVNTLCVNEQAFVNDLAAVGITPTDSPRVMVNRGQTLCGQLASGTSRSVVIQRVYGGTPMSIDQARAIVAAAENHLCNFAAVGIMPNP